MSQMSPSAPETKAPQVRQRLMSRLAGEDELPALRGAVSQVVQLASSGDEAVGDLARFILSDVALTQKILRLANTVAYRAVSGAPVTTVSRAIFLLGFDTIITSAMAILLVDAFGDSRHADAVRAELYRSLCASAIARELSRRSPFRDAEEAAIAALFRNLGRVLVAAREHEAYDEIQRRVAQPGTGTGSREAEIDVIGCTFDTLRVLMLREWRMPETTIAAMTPPSSGRLKPARSRQEWLQQTVEFSADAAALAMRPAPAPAGCAELLARYGGALDFDEEQLGALLGKAAAEARTLADQMALIVPLSAADDEPAAPASADAGIPAELLFEKACAALPQPGACHPSGKPLNARDLLLAGVQEVMQMGASPRCRINDLMLLVLETLCRGLGFRFATVCLREPRTGRFRARIAIGEEHATRQAQFDFAADGERDLFSLALANDADLLIADASAERIKSLVPSWHRALLPDARSFVVLPLVVDGRPLGLFYADRALPAPEGVPADETSLIRMLKSQVLAALSRSSKG